MADGLIRTLSIFTAGLAIGLAIGLALFVFGWIGAAMTVVAYGLRDAV